MTEHEEIKPLGLQTGRRMNIEVSVKRRTNMSDMNEKNLAPRETPDELIPS